MSFRTRITTKTSFGLTGSFGFGTIGNSAVAKRHALASLLACFVVCRRYGDLLQTVTGCPTSMLMTLPLLKYVGKFLHFLVQLNIRLFSYSR